MSESAGSGAGASARRTETIPEWKREEVDELVGFLERYDSVGVVRVAGIPSRQLQTMRRDLHGSAELRMSRNTLMGRALGAVGLDGLREHVAGQVAFVGTNDNPFGLFRQLEASKTPAPINAGEVAPNDVVIPAGDTGVDPGPFVGELQTVGADARIMDGSIHVTADSTVCEAGEPVSADLANVLGELGIEPKEVGLDLRAVASAGVLFEPEELDIDVDAYRADVETAAGRATGLSVGAAYPTARTAGTLLARGAGDARAAGLSAAVAEPDLAPDLLAQADARLRALAARIDDEEALPEALYDADDDDGVEGEVENGPADGDTDDEADGADGANDQDRTDESDDADDDADDDDGGEGLGMMFG